MSDAINCWRRNNIQAGKNNAARKALASSFSFYLNGLGLTKENFWRSGHLNMWLTKINKHETH